MLSLHALARRALVVCATTAAAIAVASCFDASSGPARAGAGVVAFTPVYQLRSAPELVPFTRVRIVLRRVDGTPAIDTVVAYAPAPGTDSMAVSLGVEILQITGVENFELNLAMVNAAGDTVFRGRGPVSVSTAAASGGAPPVPARIPTTYIGPGANADSVKFAVRDTAMRFGETLAFRASAFSVTAGPLPLTPIEYLSLDTTIVRVPDLSQPNFVARPVRGIARVVARTPTGKADTARIVVRPVPAALALANGDAQTGAAGTELAAPLAARITAADGLPVAGAFVRFFTASGFGTLSDTAAVTDADGVARTRWRLGSTVGTATATAVVSTATGAPFVGPITGSPISFTATIAAGPAATLAFTSQPTRAGAGATIAPSIAITARDAFGNIATSFTGSVTLSLTPASARGASLGGTVTLAASTGIAAFTAVKLDRANSAYRLRAVSGVIAAAESDTFSIVPGAATKLVFRTQPNRIVAGTSFTSPLAVEARDAFDNFVSTFTGEVKLRPTPGTGRLESDSILVMTAADTLALPRAVAVAGVATFARMDTVLRKTTRGVSITATASALSSAVTDTFSVLPGAAARLRVESFPATPRAAGAPLDTATHVRVEDSFGNRADSFADSVFVSLQGPVATLNGTKRVKAIAGRARFTGLSVNQANSGYGLLFVAGSFSNTSPEFSVIGGAPSALALSTPPSASAGAGIALATQPVVQLKDAFGNLAALSGVGVTVTQLESGSAFATQTVVTDATGRAVFSGVTLNGPSGTRTLQFAATLGGSSVMTSAVITLGAGIAWAPATVVTLPSSVVAGGAVTLAIRTRDAHGNAVGSSSGTVTVSVSGANARTAFSATDNSDGTYTAAYTPTAAGVDSITVKLGGVVAGASPFSVTIMAAAATSLFIQTDVPAAASVINDRLIGTTLAVRLRDASGNNVARAGVSVMVSVGSGPAGGHVNGTLSQVTDASGIATFPNLRIEGLAGSYVLRFNATIDGGAAAVTSGSTATLTPGDAKFIGFETAPPPAATSGVALTPAPVVRVKDSGGNFTTGAGASITASMTSGPGTLAGTLTVATGSDGRATFSSLTITGTTGSYVLRFTEAGTVLPAALAIDAPVSIGVGPLDHFAVTATDGSPIGAQVAGVPFNVKVVAQDASNNIVTAFTGTTAITSTSALTGAPVTTAAFTGGVLASTSVTLTGSGSAHTLTATQSSGTAAGTSAPFSVSAASATALFIQTDVPAGASVVNNELIGTTLLVRLRDGSGNNVSRAGVNVSVTVNSAPAPGHVNGTLTQATDASGVASFPDLRLEGPVGSYVLRFNATIDGAPAGVISAATATLTPGAARGIAIETAPPTTVASGTTLAPPSVIRVRDSGGNFTNGAGISVIASLASGSATLGGTLAAVTTADGRATFSSLVLTGTTGVNTLRFTADAGALPLATPVDAPVSIGVGPLDHFAVTATDGSAIGAQIAGVPFNVKVVAQDASNNTVTAFSGTTAITSTSAIAGAPVTTPAFTGGVLTAFSVTLATSGGAHTLTATQSTGGTKAGTSNAFAVNAGGAAALTIETQPSATATSGAAFAQQPVVRLRDAGGNPVLTPGVSVAATISTGGGTLGGTTTATTDASGVATFTGLAITGAAGTKTLAFTASGLPTATSASIALGAGAGSRVAVLSFPTTVPSGALVSPAPRVQLVDASGNPVAEAGRTVNVFRDGTAAVTLTGTLTATTDASGIAEFTNLRFSGPVGSTAGLEFSGPGLADVHSALLALTEGLLDHFLLEAEGGGAIGPRTAGTAFNIRVTAQDAANNTVTGFTATVDIASTDTLDAGAGTTPAFVGGVLASRTITIRNTGAIGLIATQTGGGPTGSTTVSVSAGALTSFEVLSGTATAIPGQIAGTAFTVRIRARDSFGNTVTGFSGTVNFSGAAFVGAPVTSGAFAAGIVTQSLTINPVGSYTVNVADAAGPVTGASNSFGVVAGVASAATSSATVPSSGIAGLVTTMTVITRDAFGNPRTTSSGMGAVTASVSGVNAGATVSSTDNGNGTYTLSYTPASSGSDAIAILLDVAGTPTAITGSPFSTTVSPPPPSTLSITTQPSATTASGAVFAQQPAVQLRDGFGAPVATPGISVSVAITGGGGTLGGAPIATTDASGVATFTGLSITGTLGVRTLQFTSSGYSPVTSASVDVNTAGAAALLSVTQEPSPTNTTGTPFVQQPVVRIKDSGGNFVAQAGVPVTAAIPPIIEGGTLAGTVTVNTDASGTATFTNLSITGSGVFRLDFTGGGFTAVSSANFNVGAAPALSALVIAAGDSQYVAVGSAMTELKVRALNSVGDPVSGVPVTWTGVFTGTLVVVDSTSDAMGFARANYTPTAIGSGHVEARILVGVEDTRTAYLDFVSKPADVSRVWRGGPAGPSQSSWNVAGNWAPAIAPTASDVVMIPTSAFAPPIMAGSETVGGLYLEPGAAIQNTGWTLTIAGNLGGFGTVTGGIVEFTGTGPSHTLDGASFPAVVIRGRYLVMNDFFTESIVVTGASAQLDVDDSYTYASGNFRTEAGGTLKMTRGGGLDIDGDFLAAGGSTTGLLTSGLIDVGGSFTQSGASSPSSFDAVAGLETSFAGANITFSNPEQSAFGILTFTGAVPTVNVAGTAGSTALRVRDDFWMGGANLLVTTPGIIRIGNHVVGAGPLTHRITADSIDFNNTTTYGDIFGVTLDAPVHVSGSARFYESDATSNVLVSDTLTLRYSTIAGNVLVTGANSMLVAADTATINGTLTTASGGKLAMDCSCQALRVVGNVIFNGGNTDGLLTGGRLRLGGTFVQGSDSHANAFRANAAHETIFDGPTVVTFATPDTLNSRFGTVRFRAVGDTSRIFSNMAVHGTLDIDNGGRLVQAPASSQTVWVLGDSVHVDGSLSVGTLLVAGAFHQETLGGSFAIDTVVFSGLGQTVPPLPGGAMYKSIAVTGIATTGAPLTITGSLTLASPTASHGSLQLAHRVSVAGDVQVGAESGAEAHLTLNGKTLTVDGSFIAEGNGLLDMRQSLDSLIVAGYVGFAGANTTGYLEAGAIVYGGSFEQYGGGQSFAPSLAHRVVRNALTTGIISFNDPATSFFNRLHLTGSGVTEMTSNVLVKDTLTVSGTGSLTHVAGPARTLTTLGHLALSGAAMTMYNLILSEAPTIGGPFNAFNLIYENPVAMALPVISSHGSSNVFIRGEITDASANQTFSTLTIDQAGSLRIGPHTLFVTGDFATGGFGILKMMGPTDSLTVLGNTTFAGGSTNGWLTNGAIRMEQGFTQDGTRSAASFRPTGLHKVRVVGSIDRAFVFSTPDTGIVSGSSFNLLDVHSAGSTITVNGVVPVEGTFNLAGAGGSNTFTGANGTLWLKGPVNVGNGNQATLSRVYLTQSPTIVSGSKVEPDTVIWNGSGSLPALTYKSLRITSNTTLTTGLTTANDLVVNGATLLVGGNTVDVGRKLHIYGYNAYLWMQDPSDVVTVGDSAIFDGDLSGTKLSLGSIVLNGAFVQRATHNVFSFHSVGTVVHFAEAATLPSIQFASGGWDRSRFNRLQFDNDGSTLSQVALKSDVYIVEQLATSAAPTAARTIASSAGNRFTLHTHGLDAERLNFDNVAVQVDTMSGGFVKFNNIVWLTFDDVLGWDNLHVFHNPSGPTTFTMNSLTFGPVGTSSYHVVADAPSGPNTMTLQLNSPSPAAPRKLELRSGLVIVPPPPM